MMTSIYKPFSLRSEFNQSRIIILSKNESKFRNLTFTNLYSTNLTKTILNPYFEYHYDPLIMISGIIISLIGSYNALETIQNLKYMNNKKHMILMLFFANLSYSIISLWAPNFIYLYSMKFNEIDLYLDTRLTIFCLLSTILCNISGSCIALLPFFDRTYNEYKKKITDIKLSTLSYNQNKNIAKKKKSFTFKKFFYQNMTNINNQNILNFNSVNVLNNNNKNYALNNSNHHDMSNSNISLNALEKMDKNNNIGEFKDLNKNLNNENEILENIKINENNAYNNYPTIKFSCKEDFDMSSYFLSNKLSKKEIVYFIIGGFIIGLSFLIMNFLGINSIKINGEIKFNLKAQIVISLLVLMGGYFLHFAFYYKNKFWIKIALSIAQTLTYTILRSLSINNINFEKFEYPNSDLIKKESMTSENKIYNLTTNYTKIPNSNITYEFKLNDTSGLIKIDLLYKIILTMMILLPYVLKDITIKKVLFSNKIIKFLTDYTKIGTKELTFILKFCEVLKVKEFKHNYVDNLNNFNIIQNNENQININKEYKISIKNDNEEERNNSANIRYNDISENKQTVRKINNNSSISKTLNLKI